MFHISQYLISKSSWSENSMNSLKITINKTIFFSETAILQIFILILTGVCSMIYLSLQFHNMGIHVLVCSSVKFNYLIHLVFHLDVVFPFFCFLWCKILKGNFSPPLHALQTGK